MALLKSRFFVCIALISMLFGSPFDAIGGLPLSPPVEDFERQTARLASKIQEERLEAINWLRRHAQTDSAGFVAPQLERCVDEAEDVAVRTGALECLAEIALKRNGPCPPIIVRAILDKNQEVRQTAGLFAERFKSFPPGSIDQLLKGVASHDSNLRGDCLGPLAIVGRNDKRTVSALDEAAKDQRFIVRHNARIAKFRVTDDLVSHLAYLIRLQEDEHAEMKGVDTTTMAGRIEKTSWNLAKIGVAMRVIDWTENRQDDLAKSLLKLTRDPSPVVRRGATRFIAASAVKVDLPDGKAPTGEVEGLLGDELFEPAAEPPRPKPKRKSKAGVRLLELDVEARLRELHDDDPDLVVRAAAKRALERYAYAKTLPPP